MKGLLGISQEKVEVTSATSTPIQEGIDKTIAKYRERHGLDGKNFNDADEKFVERNVATMAVGVHRLNTEAQEDADKAAEALAKDDDPDIPYSQRKALTASTFVMVKGLLELHPTKKEFKIA